MDGNPAHARPPLKEQEAEVPLLRWSLNGGTECLVASVSGSFEVRLVRDGEMVRTRRFKLPGPALDLAHAWRRDVSQY
jgi:hypothetical protein